MFYQCTIEGNPSTYIFDTSDNTCEYISNKDYNLVKSKLGSAPDDVNCYGFSDYMKYRLFYMGKEVPLVSWVYNGVRYIAGVFISKEYPDFYIHTSFGSRVDVLNKDNCINLCVYDSTLSTFIPYEMFGVLIRNRNYIKKLLIDVEVRFRLEEKYSKFKRGQHIISKSTILRDEFENQEN